MRCLRLLLCSVVLVFALCGRAQEFEQTDSKNVPEADRAKGAVTYFLIDASGSMADKDAEVEVSRLLTPIRDADPTALVSRTYFRASTWDACRASVTIEGFVPAAESAAQKHSHEDDYTPSGEALKAAILDAVSRDAPANIYLVSDEDQTPGCGVDVCDVASALLPIEGITVQSIPVAGTKKSGHDRLGCIGAAQGNFRPAENLGNGKAGSISPPSPWERWAWLIGFLLVALSAAGYGMYDATKAVDLDNDTQEARSLREGVRVGDQQAEAELAAKQDKLKTEIEARLNSWANQRWWRLFVRWFAHPKFWLSWLGAGLLFVLVFSPSDSKHLGMDIGKAQAAAWGVLNTEFATAFAVLWLATVFFMTSQSQRSREAKRNYSIVMEEAQRIQDAVDAGERKAAFSEYDKAWNAVASAKFPDLPAPRSWDVAQEEDEMVPWDEAIFEKAKVRVRELATTDKLSVVSKPDELRERTSVLKGLMDTGPWWNSRWDLGVFVSNLLVAGIIKEDREAWQGVVASFERGDPKLIRASLSALMPPQNAGNT